MNRLVKFQIKINQTLATFNIYGTYTVSMNGKHPYPEFNGLTATIEVGTAEEPYIPDTKNWHGESYNVEDMIQDHIASLIQQRTSYNTLYLDDGLKDLVDVYTKDENIILTVKDLKIPKYVLSSNMYDIYELTMITDKYIYYVHDDQALMLDTNTHEIISDNYFASVGYMDSIELITKGSNEEILLWGEIPKEMLS